MSVRYQISKRLIFLFTCNNKSHTLFQYLGMENEMTKLFALLLYIVSWYGIQGNGMANIPRLPRVAVDKAPLFTIVNNRDGSLHHLLGTMHQGINIYDIPYHSYLHSVIEHATVFIGERMFSIDDLLNANPDLKVRFDAIVDEKAAAQHSYRLINELGGYYWGKMQQMLRDNFSVDEVDQHIDKMDDFSAEEAVLLLATIGLDKAFADQNADARGKISLDGSLFIHALSIGKKAYALDTPKDTALYHLHAAKVERPATVQDLKELIDKGGVDYIENTLLAMRDAYVRADLQTMLSLYGRDMKYYKSSAEELFLDFRNRRWIERGIIQENCQQGEHCLIFVGAAHLSMGDDSLFKLLPAEGFTIEEAVQ